MPTKHRENQLALLSNMILANFISEIKTGVTQTAAVDIWSLGIVAMVFLTGETDLASQLKDMDQLDMMTAILNRLSLSSHEAKSFIIGCLQLNPNDRLTAAETQNHNWLYPPAKQRTFFEELDRRMLEGWSEDTQLRPMPIQIDDLAPIMSEVYQSKPVNRTSSSPAAIASAQPKSPPPRKTVYKTHKRAKRLQDRGIRVPDYLHLPLTDLDKHLKKAPSNDDYREKILQQLQTTSAKFL